MRKFTVMIYGFEIDDIVTAWQTEACCVEAVEYEIRLRLIRIMETTEVWIRDMEDDLYRYGVGDTTEGTVLITEVKVDAEIG